MNPAEFYFTKEQIEAFHNNRFESAKKAIEKLRDSERPISKKLTIDLSQPIKELKRYNKQLSKSIELQAGVKKTVIKQLSEADDKTLEHVRHETKNIFENTSDSGTVVGAVRQLAKMQNLTAGILQKHLSDGNI